MTSTPKIKPASPSGKKKEKVLLEEQDYFHGMLCKEDVEEMLLKKGDFIVWMMDGEGLKDVSITNQTNDENEKEKCTINNEKYGSVPELVEKYVQKKKKLDPKNDNSIPITPIHRFPWEIAHENVTLSKDKLGEGQFGTVFKGTIKIEARTIDVAVKTAKATTEKQEIENVLKEAKMMRNYQHPHVIKMYGVALQKDPLMIIMEFIDGQALNKFLEEAKDSDKPPTEEEKLEKMILPSAWGLEYLHFKKCIHRDIAARNVLYSKSGVAKICDFGLSRQGVSYKNMDDQTSIPWRWVAPECYKTDTYDALSDVWAFGWLAWEVYTFAYSLPYGPYTRAEMMEVFKGEFCKDLKARFPSETPPQIAEIFMENVFVPHKERKNMTEVCKLLEKETKLAVCRDNVKLRKPAKPVVSMESVKKVSNKKAELRKTRTR
ncbi:unnamed protein product [Bursaphelenchus okinawaensis]|uniref:non-specific protein-tyrosine kinase n=1 Tax=Bursaphelenchus okinawaensis TaxID=465554 RepID=A0A811L1R1_9BILA|nr:unnamed protein product [Bursaphelenchus okinawaensis]CAG9117133.1 unnamed protein product [Bursaphelenchus okinawaensis]